MNDSLQTYLHDHLAGSNFAIEVLNSLRDQNTDQASANFAAGFVVEVQKDAELLRHVIEQVGESHFDLKEAAAWLAEKASRFKLRHETPGSLGTFEALELLSLGVMGKLALWRVLPVIRTVDARVPKLDFAKLATSAQDQYARIEEYRLRFAPSAFGYSA